MKPSEYLPSYLPDFGRVRNEAYDPTANPDGYVNFGVAENKLVQETLLRRLEGIRVKVEPKDVGYSDFTGTPGLKQAVARVLERWVFKAPVERPEDLVIYNGLTTAVSLLGMIMCDAGEEMMYVSPGYPGFRMDLEGFAGCGTVNVSCRAGPSQLPSDEELEAARRPSVKAFLLCTPDNPTGKVWPREELGRVVRWCRGKGLWVVSDEVYGGSVFGDGAEFHSLWDQADVTLWGLSKDFCMSGARCGVVFTQNEDLLARLKAWAPLGNLSNVAHSIFEELLGDDEWVDAYIAEGNAALKTAQGRCRAVLDGLRLPYVGGSGAVFLWVDFSEFAGEFGGGSFGLYRSLMAEARLFLTPGSEFFDRGKEEGCSLRLCFAATPHLEQGLGRLEQWCARHRGAADGVHKSAM